MKSAIAYYSYSGNTRKVSDVLAEYLFQKGGVEQIELVPLDESESFLGQCRRAFSRTRAALTPVTFDLAHFDIICFGTPVWAFGPAPAMNTYLDKCAGLENKEIILFTTYGSGTGNERCLNYMQDLLRKKNATRFSRFSVQQHKVGNKEEIIDKINEVLRLAP